jgi:phytoene dehydrogenase-like protein
MKNKLVSDDFCPLLAPSAQRKRRPTYFPVTSSIRRHPGCTENAKSGCRTHAIHGIVAAAAFEKISSDLNYLPKTAS